MKQEDSNRSSSEDLDQEISATDESRRPIDRGRERRDLIIGASVVVLVLVVIVLAVWKWRKSGTGTEEKTTPVVSVRVAKAEKQTIAAQVSAVGTIFPREQATVGAKISAQIKQMALLKNKVVKAGDVIAVLESRDLQAQRAEAVAALNEALANQRSVT